MDVVRNNKNDYLWISQVNEKFFANNPPPAYIGPFEIDVQRDSNKIYFIYSFHARIADLVTVWMKKKQKYNKTNKKIEIGRQLFGVFD